MTDESLMQAVNQGDTESARLLFEQYHQKIFGFILKMTMDRELSLDLTQNVFLRMLKYRHSFKNDSKFKPWIFQIARNVMADQWRKQPFKSKGHIPIEEIQEHYSGKDCHHQDNGEFEQLYMAMDKLSTDEKELLVLSKFEGLKYKEIAKMNTTTEDNIKMKVHRAIKKLRDHYFQLENL